MWLGVLGPLQVRDQATVIPVPAAKQRIVLGALLAQANQVVSFEQLTEVVWDGAGPPGARPTLRNYVKRLRQILGPAVGGRIRTHDPGYLIEVTEAELDLLRFTQLCRSGGAAVRAGSWERAETALAEALQLWRGPALVDIPSDALRRDEVPRLEQLRLQAVEWRLEAQLQLGLHVELVPQLQGLVAQHPLHERFYAQLMLACYRAGRRADALAVYHDGRRLLIDELGVEPGPELRSLQQRILAGDLPLWTPPPAESGLTPGVPPATLIASDGALAGAGAAGSGLASMPPRQLPPISRYFAGRTAELNALDALLDQVAPDGGAVVISAIGGTAGVGKTALALHWAHRVAARFPDGQLYVNLRGFDPSGTPVPPADAIRGFLDALQVPPAAIPADPQAQAGLYRSLLATRRFLIVLDNARHAQQVRPLVPGAPGCLVVVTSRSRLTGLVASEGAYALTLDLLTEAEASELLAQRLGGRRLADEPEARSELIRLCARLPLALSITTARAAMDPDLSLAAVAAELREARLDALTTGEVAMDVRAVLSWSCQNLSGPGAQMFRLLAVHPGPDIGAAAAASLAGLPLPQARTVLAELTGAHLIEETAPGR
jgi:DNA-binding SARP family transcriptional activator